MDASTHDDRETRLSTARSGRAWACWVALTVALISQAGCQGAGENTDKMVPRQWRGNPWGPDADLARRCGELPTIPYNPRMTAWDAWARQNLHEGDILFRLGNARAACGLFPFSKVFAAMADSRYSHSGIVAWEEGAPVVYDTSTTGPRRQPFAIWLLDTAGGFGVKRPAPAYQSCIPSAVAFCREVYRTQVPFDLNLKLGDDRFYCIELTERAYRSAGLPLSEPLRIDQLPRYNEYPVVVRLVRLFSSLDPAQEAYIIGNDNVGIWSSRALETVYEASDTRRPYEPGAASASLARGPGGPL